MTTPDNDALLPDRIFKSDEHVELEHEVGTLSGTRDQISGLASENARRMRGDQPMFYDGEQLDI